MFIMSPKQICIFLWNYDGHSYYSTKPLLYVNNKLDFFYSETVFFSSLILNNDDLLVGELVKVKNFILIKSRLNELKYNFYWH